jgi:hypothetical protein
VGLTICGSKGHHRSTRISVRHADTTEQSGNISPRSSLRSILLLGAVLLCIAGGFSAYVYVLRPVRYEVLLQPETLPAVPGATVELRAVGLSRFGSTVPWSAQAMRCDVLEGGGLVELGYNADSTVATITSLGYEGEIQLRITIPDWPFPLLATLRIMAPMARSHFSSQRRLPSV